MIEPQLAAAFAQFGVAGLIGWMWLTERRAATARDRQLAELHERLLQERPQIHTLVRIIADNTRALTALEVGQRHLSTVLERLVSSSMGRSP